MSSNEMHEPVTRTYVEGGQRFACQQCGASVSVPSALIDQWEREKRLDAEIQPRITRTLLLQHHTGRQWQRSVTHTDTASDQGRAGEGE